MKTGTRRIISLLITALLMLMSCRMASASSELSKEEELRELDRSIVLALVDLAQFNARYQQAVNHHMRWRNLVYPLGQEGCYAGFFGYSVMDVVQRSKNWNSPRNIPKSAVRHGLESATVGSTLGAGSSTLELLCQYIEDRDVHRKGFGSESATNHVRSSIAKIDALVEQRERLLPDVLPQLREVELQQLKGHLCQYERDRLAYEFKQWNAQARGYFWYRNAFYVQNVLANAVRFSALQVAFKALQSRPYLGAVGPILITSSVLASVSPLVSSKIGDYVRRKQARIVAAKLPAKPYLTDEQAKQQFERLSELLNATNVTGSQYDDRLRAQLACLRKERIGLDAVINQGEQNIEKLRRVAAQQSITAPVVGAITAGAGTTSTVNYYGFRLQPRNYNHIGFSADIGTLTAEAIALYATPKAVVSAFLYEQKLKRQSLHPDQILAKRLQELKALEEMVKDPTW